MQRLVTTTYLEMTDPGELRPALERAPHFTVRRAEVPSPELNRSFYTAVGARWSWWERLPWDLARWLAHVDRPELETWVGYLGETPAGYFELEHQDGDVQIVYFGLLPAFVGQGLGGALLTSAIARGWQMGARRVWVHTCDLDHPHALANYIARGMRPYRVEHHQHEVSA